VTTIQPEQMIAALLVTAAIFSYFNERFLGISATIGMLLISLFVALSILIAGQLGWTTGHHEIVTQLETLDFNRLLMDGMLGFLLFAGAMHVQMRVLVHERWAVMVLAVFCTLGATFLIGSLTWLGLRAVGTEISFIYALVFGALISPTDPIAAVSILKKIGMPDTLETLISGESLFNDGIGAVLFSVVAGIAFSGETPSVWLITLDFGKEVIGGLVLGAVLALIACKLLRDLEEDASRILVTLALVAGGGVLARMLHVSNPLAMVVAGLVVGSRSGQLMNARSQEAIGTFWKLTEDLLNAVLFLLLGLFVLESPYSIAIVPMLVAIVAVLAGRFISVIIPVRLWFIGTKPSVTELQLTTLMTWGGLRGAISIALLLSLPSSGERELLFEMTYAVVVFSLLVQGLTIGRLFTQDQLRKIAELPV
jgi:CPA1 family monovalent cation:H+ antiporter